MLAFSAPTEGRSGKLLYNDDLENFPTKGKHMGNIGGIFLQIGTFSKYKLIKIFTYFNQQNKFHFAAINYSLNI